MVPDELYAGSPRAAGPGFFFGDARLAQVKVIVTKIRSLFPEAPVVGPERSGWPNMVTMVTDINGPRIFTGKTKFWGW